MAIYSQELMSSRIAERIASGEHPGLSVETDTGSLWLPPNEARNAVRSAHGYTSLRDPVWRAAIWAAQHGYPDEEMGLLFAVWLAGPWMGRAIRKIRNQLRTPYEDLEAEMIASFLEELVPADPDEPGVSSKILKGATANVWKLARMNAQELPIRHPSLIALPDPAYLSTRDRYELEITPPAHPSGLAASIRFTASADQVEGERLGMLAHQLGLGDIVYRARRPAEGPPVGDLSVHAARVAR